MKRISLFLVLALGLSISMTAQSTVAPVEQAVETPSTEGPQMEFTTLEVDYGTIEQGSDPYRFFQFTNPGTAPLVITNAKGSCGCTVPTYPKEPILPGNAGEIKVRYDTNRVGPFTKRVTLTTNVGEEPIVLTIKGKVEKAPEEPAGVPTNEGGMFNSGGN
ncbi:DUF1573 domain-containing protein [Lewinella sp. LCG006]|uniref:DUF1573 domain-containing protein n=1 Tax=Lewinella sp. LCG006 TaxID=3231911 RepID=UPI00345FB690